MSEVQQPVASDSAGQPYESPLPITGESVGPAIDLRWVWSEVRKRVFIKVPWSTGIADAMEAAVPLALDDNTFVVGLAHRDYPMASYLSAEAIRNIIEGILRAAAGRTIRFEVIEGTSPEDWAEVRERQQRAQDAVVAMAQKRQGSQHVEDVIHQIVSELRARVSGSRDRTLPQVKASLLLDMAPQLADTEEMLFPDPDTHEARRIIARLIDRVAAFLEVPPLDLALEVERARRASKAASAQPRASTQRSGANQEAAVALATPGNNGNSDKAAPPASATSVLDSQ